MSLTETKKWATVETAPQKIHTDLTKEGTDKLILDLRLNVAELQEKLRAKKGDMASLELEVQEYKAREQKRRDRRRAGLGLEKDTEGDALQGTVSVRVYVGMLFM